MSTVQQKKALEQEIKKIDSLILRTGQLNMLPKKPKYSEAIREGLRKNSDSDDDLFENNLAISQKTTAETNKDEKSLKNSNKQSLKKPTDYF